MQQANTILAQAFEEVCPAGASCPEGGAVPIQGFEGLFANLLNAILGLAGIVLFIMLIIGGFKYITSGGDPKAAAAARLTLTHAIMGLVLVASAFLILVLIENFTGAPVTTFRIFVD